MEKSGILALTSLKDRETEILIKYMSGSRKAPYLDYLNIILGKDLLRFIDLFSGETIKVPTRDETIKIINYIKIYVYLNDRGFTDGAYESASKVFARRRNSIKRIVDKVESTILKDTESAQCL